MRWGVEELGDIVSVSEIPGAGDDLEDYVAALFQSSGYYVEKSLIERDPDDILELDLVASRYSRESTRRLLAEVKGGKWGYSDIFKIAGWLQYLGIHEGCFLVKKPDEHLSKMRDRVARLGVSLVHFDDFSRASETFQAAGLGEPMSPSVVELWRYSYAAERKYLEVVASRSKSEKSQVGPQEAQRYYRLIKDGTFFAQSPAESLKLLYDAYMQHPKFTAANASEMDGSGYDPQGSNERSGTFAEALIQHRHPYLHACMYLTHRARLSILKAAVDHIVSTPDGSNDALADLPASLQSAVEWLRGQPSFWLYATFWQQLLWGLGGFVIDELLDREYDLMSTFSGIPQGEIPTALQAFDKFFPRPNGWFRVVGPTSIRQLVLMPIVFKGLGAHCRWEHYMRREEERSFSRLVSQGYSAKDLTTWNNRAVEFLA
jgi:hypothetical protein